MKISACIITCDEEANLPRCLASIKDLVDEIVIADSGSTDKTESIAASFGARFIHRDWSGYVAQKNFALEQATHPWVLSIDADEEISPELAASIRDLRQQSPEPNLSGYLISRLVHYKNQWIRHGDWFPDWLVRLFQRDRAKFVGGQVHERLEIEGETKKLDGFMRHYTYFDQADREARIAHYAELWAASAFVEGRRAPAWAPTTHALVRFVRGYVLKGGFLDGGIGLEIARGNAHEVYLKYKNLRKLNGEQ